MKTREIEIETISYYKAPYHTKVRPYMIKEGFEYIELINDGEVFFDDGNGLKSRRCGSLFWHIPGDFTVHESNPDFPYQCLCVRFMKKSTGQREVPRVSLWNDEYEVRKFTDTVLRAFHSDAAGKDLLCDYVYSRLKWEASSSHKVINEHSNPPALKKAISYIEENFMENIDTAAIAEFAGISESHLFLLFREGLQSSPYNYLNQVKIREAKQNLVRTSDSIKEISANCGFINIESFYRVFKKLTGISPGEYRKRFAATSYLKES